MIVIPHHDMGVQPPTIVLTGLNQCLLECLHGYDGLKDIPPVIAAIDHMIHRSFELDAQLTGHGRKLGYQVARLK